MGQLQSFEQAIAKAKNAQELFTIEAVKDRFVKNFEAVTGRKDGLNRLEQERFAYLQLIHDKGDDVKKAAPFYHFSALIYAATTGLSFRDNKIYVQSNGKGGLKVSTSPAGKREMLEMMKEVKEAPEAVLVLKGDKFSWDKRNRRVLEHTTTEKSITDTKLTLDNIVAAYQTIYYNDNTSVDVVVTHDELVKAKSKSKMPDKGPWVDWVGEMCKKTATNRAFRLYHRYPDNVVTIPIDDSDDDGTDDSYKDAEVMPDPTVTEAPDNVDAETGEVHDDVTPTEEYKPEEKKTEKKGPGKQQASFMD
jgi:hypothetical protein